jgi:hypothetical protein
MVQYLRWVVHRLSVRQEQLVVGGTVSEKRVCPGAWTQILEKGRCHVLQQCSSNVPATESEPGGGWLDRFQLHKLLVI